MAISLRNVSTSVGTTATTNTALTWTQSCAIGDVVVITYDAMNDSGSSPAASFTTSGGEPFVSLFSQQMTPSGNTHRGQVGYFIIATGTSTPTSRTFSAAPNGNVANGRVVDSGCFKGVDTASPILNALTSATNSTGSNVQAGPLNLAVSQAGAAYVVCFMSSSPGSGATFQGSGYSSLNNVGKNQQGAATIGSFTKNATTNGQVFSDAFWTADGDNFLVNFSLRAALLPEGPVQTNLFKISQSAAGNVVNKAVVRTDLTKASLHAVGKADYVGRITTNLTKASFAAIALPYDVGGPVVTRLQSLSQLASAQHRVLGHSVTALRPTSQRVTAEVRTIGQINTVLKGINSSSVVAQQRFIGVAATHLQPMAQALAGLHIVIGQVNTRLGSATGRGLANVVIAEQIITATVVTALQPINFTVLGAQLGMPGAGKWYSYRYLDS